MLAGIGEVPGLWGPKDVKWECTRDGFHNLGYRECTGSTIGLGIVATLGCS